jgi:hypothetical protein
MSHPLAAAPSPTSRVLGAAGILGGTVLLAAFVIEIPSGLNNVRLVLYFLGAIAVIVAVHRRQASRGNRWSTVVAAAAIASNVWYPVMLLLSIGRPIRHDVFGEIFFYAALAWWLTDAAFGFDALRLGAVTRWGALALGVGSLLAILGMSQLGLTTPGNPTIVAPIALTGVALNGVAWILLGLDVMLGGSPALRLRSALAR